MVAAFFRSTMVAALAMRTGCPSQELKVALANRDHLITFLVLHDQFQRLPFTDNAHRIDKIFGSADALPIHRNDHIANL